MLRLLLETILFVIQITVLITLMMLLTMLIGWIGSDSPVRFVGPVPPVPDYLVPYGNHSCHIMKNTRALDPISSYQRMLNSLASLFLKVAQDRVLDKKLFGGLELQIRILRANSVYSNLFR